MKRPEISVENHKELYKYYENLEPNQRLIKLTHILSRIVCHPYVEFEPGAEAQIQTQHQRDARHMVVSTHFRKRDQFHVSAAFQRIEVLRPILKPRVFVPAKASYYSSSIMRRYLDAVDGVPAIRKEDLVGKDVSAISIGRAASSFINMSVTRLQRGENEFVFPGGTRKKDNLTELGDLKAGVAKTAYRAASEETPISILPMAIWYGREKEKQHTSRPQIFIGCPIPSPFESEDYISDRARSAMEFCLESAIKISDERYNATGP